MGRKSKKIKKKLRTFKLSKGPRVKIAHKLKKNIMPKIIVPVKTKGRPKGSKNKKTEAEKIIDKPQEIPVPDFQGPIRNFPSCLEFLPSKPYFASNKGRLTNQEIIDYGLEFACTTGNIWNYKFK